MLPTLYIPPFPMRYPTPEQEQEYQNVLRIAREELARMNAEENK